jgi:dipeptidyl aminopeptidase/acylaminoacyl peptidase
VSLFLFVFVATVNAQIRSLTQSSTANVAARNFTVRDDVEMVHFVDPFQTRLSSPIEYSPDGRYFAVVTERGLLESNRVEDTVWVFSTSEISATLSKPSESLISVPSPLTKVSASKAPAICYIKWLGDSSGLALIADIDGGHQLYEIKVKDRHLRRLSDAAQDVSAFDIEGDHVLYSAVSPAAVDSISDADNLGSAMDGTGLDLGRIVLDKLPNSPLRQMRSLCDLWRLVDGKALRIEDKYSHLPIHVHQRPNGYSAPVFRLSPDGTRIAAQLALDDVPPSWELLPPSDELPARRIKAGPQDVRNPRLLESVDEYALIDVSSGRVTSITNAPIGWEDAYYSAFPAMSWASDGRSLALANTFIGNETNESSKRPSSDERPCIAVVNVATLAATCAVRLPVDSTELRKSGLHRMVNVRFNGDDSNKIIVDAVPERADGGADLGRLVHLYLNRDGNGSWMESRSASEMADHLSTFVASVEQNLNSPPQLVVQDRISKTFRILLNPNEKMREVALGTASVFHWEDKEGRKWTGGLVKPPTYIPGTKYPLVLQTHGFDQAAFMSYGSFPSCMAARELAGAGFVVLQMAGPVNEDQWFGTSEEASMEVAGFDSAVDQLSLDGVADRDKVGIIGFSRTVYGVMEALTKGKTKYRAASICDGMQGGYMEYMLSVDVANNEAKNEFDSLIGSSPFGEGLQKWMQRSPNFNLEKISAPLMIQTFGSLSTLYMWEPYAGLRLLKKPVDLAVVNTNDEQHVLSNPRARMASQGLDVDWFRFWLQGYERPNPEDQNQYKRWEHLKDLRDADAKAAAEHPQSYTAN